MRVVCGAAAPASPGPLEARGGAAEDPRVHVSGVGEGWEAAAGGREAGREVAAGSYEAKAPSKSEIFSEGNAGQSIKIACWIGRSVTVPNLD